MIVFRRESEILLMKKGELNFSQKGDDMVNIERSELSIRNIFKESQEMMLRKNRERGDCWKAVGLVGTYIEIKSMFYRLKGIIWDGLMLSKRDGLILSKRAFLDEKEKAEVLNCLQDIRNFTILAELSINDDNFFGEDYD
jgi:hypothetical protein